MNLVPLTPKRAEFPLFRDPQWFKEHFESQGFSSKYEAGSLDGPYEIYEKGDLIIKIPRSYKALTVGAKTNSENMSFAMSTDVSRHLPGDEFLDEAFFRFWEAYKFLDSSYSECVKKLFPHDNFIYFAFDNSSPKNPRWFRSEDGIEKMKCVVPLEKSEDLQGKMEFSFREFDIESIRMSLDIFPFSSKKTILETDFVPSREDPREELMKMFRSAGGEMKTLLTKNHFQSP